MATTTPYCRRSADVKIELRVNGSVIPVAQLGPNFLILEDAEEHAPGDGEIIMRVDENEHRWPVSLPEGVSHDSRTVRIRNH